MGNYEAGVGWVGWGAVGYPQNAGVLFFTVSKLIKAWLWGNLVTTFTQRQFWPLGIVIACICLSICVCRHQSYHNLSPFQSRITRFEPEVQNTLVWWVIDLYLKAKFNLKVNIYPILNCPCDDSPPVEFGISKFGPKCILALLRSLLILGLIDWPSISLAIF